MELTIAERGNNAATVSQDIYLANMNTQILRKDPDDFGNVTAESSKNKT